MVVYTRLIRPLFFRLTPENAHHVAVAALKILAYLPPLRAVLRAWLHVTDPTLGQSLLGRYFANPVGFAAGFDKNAEVVGPLSDLGFSHIEIGTVTAEAQPGNPKPRCFRLKQDQSLINRMGINNDGARVIAERLQQRYGAARQPGERRPACLLGVNIGKTTAVAVEQTVEDQQQSARLLAPLADYLVVNVSCPNVKGMTGFQSAEHLRPLLSGLNQTLTEVAPGCHLLIKVAPDLDDESLDAVVDVGLECGCQGFVATNTTTRREGLMEAESRVTQIGQGGLSGRALRSRSTQVLARVARRVNGRVPIIGVGGVDDVETAWEKIIHGASLVQVYTGFIYQGPTLVRDINRGLQKKLRQQGFRSISEAVGSQL